MKSRSLMAFLVLAVPAVASGQGETGGPATAKDTVTASAARQTTPDSVLVALPFICVDSQPQGRAWADTIRLFRTPTAGDAATTPELFSQVTVTAQVLFEDEGEKECFSQVLLRATVGSLDPKAEYRVLVGDLEARNVIVKPVFLTVALRKLRLEFDRRNPSHLVVVTPVPLQLAKGSGGTSSNQVTRTENGKASFEVIEQELVGAAPGPYRLHLIVDPPVRTGMKIEVAAKDDAGVAISGSDNVKFAVPKNKAESEFFAQLAAEAGEDQKPNLLLDLKLDRATAVPLGERWTLGVVLNMEIATKDSAETNKLNLAYPFTHTWIYAIDGRETGGVGALYSRFTPRIEADDVFASRNVVAELSTELVALALHGALGDPGIQVSKEKRELQWKYSVVPRLGYQWGENQHLEDDKLVDFEGYSVSRGAAEIQFSLARKLPSLGNVRSFSFSVTYSGWYRFSHELDTFTDANGESAVRLDDGYADYLTASLDLGLSDAFGIVVKYQTGERPALFKDEDKASIGISYRL